MQNNQWSGSNWNSLFGEFIAVIMACCESEFCQVYVNSLGNEWNKIHSASGFLTNSNTTPITGFIVQQQAIIEVFDLAKDDRFHEQKSFINDQHIRHFFGVPLIASDGLVVGFICIMNTSPKRLTEYQKLMIKFLTRDIILQVEVLKRDYQLQEVTQLRNELNKELDEFTYIASHDLASPLNAIKNIVTWIEEDINDGISHDNPKYFKMIKNSLNRMNRLLKDLGSYSRIQRIDAAPEQLSLRALVSECCKMLETTENFEFQVDEIEFELTKQPLVLIFKHLISNSIKHHHKNSGVVCIACLAYTEHYQFTITDDGPGIAPEFHKKIFKPFQTLKPKDEMEASGLGLAIIKKIVTLYSGSLTLDSQIGSGAKFTLVWPKNSDDGKAKYLIR